MTVRNHTFTGFLSAATGIIVAEYAFVLSCVIISVRVLGEVALGSIALLMPVFAAVAFCIDVIAVGTAMACAEALGRLERDRANVLAGQGLIASLVVGGALAFGVSLLHGPYLSFMVSGGAESELAGALVRWLPMTVFVGTVDLVLVHVVYIYGGERLCVVSCVAQILVNVFVSYGLCGGMWGFPALGIAGIAVGASIACIVGVLLLLPAILRGCGGLRFVFRWDLESFLESTRVSVGEVSSGFFHAFLFLVVAKFMIVRYGVESLPVAAVVFCIIRLTVCFRGAGMALRMMEPSYHSEGNRLAVKRLVRFASFISLAESVLLMGIVLIAPELIVSLFDIRNPEIAAATVRAIRLTVIGLAGYAATYPLCVHYSCIGRPVCALGLSVLAFFGVPTVLLCIFGAIYGMDGVCLAVAVGPLAPLAALLPVFHRRLSEPLVRMWSIALGSGEKVALVLDDVREALRGTCSDNSLKRTTDVLMLALKRLHERNGEHCRVEISLLFGKENVELILRDDGVHEALDDLGLPVVHVPTGCVNRNVFTVPLGGASRSLSTRKKGGRYVVLRGKDVPIEDVEAIIALDRESFTESYQVAPEQDIELFKANRENGLVIKDSKTGEVVAYSMLLPVRDEIYDRILTGRFIDTALTSDMVLTFDRPGIYRMYFASIVIHPAHRGASLLLTMFDAMVADFVALAERGIFGASLAADVVSQDGEKFAKLFGLSEIRKTDHASRIFEVRGLPPEFRVTTPATERLVGLYWEKFVQEKLNK